MKTVRRVPGRRGIGGSEAGFTLMEILCALTILSIALTAVFATFTSQHKSYVTQNRVVEMQQNLRLATDFLMRDVRMAGYGMPMTTNTVNDNVVFPAGILPGGATSMRALFPVDNTAGPDQLYVLYLYDMDANQPPVTLTSMPDVSSVTGTIDNTLPNGFRPGGEELILVTDGITADLYQTSAVSSGSSPTLTFGGGSPYNGGHHSKVYLPGATPGFAATMVGKARFVRYYIANVVAADGTTRPTLMLDRMIAGQSPQPVAEDIEDLQISYGIDTNADGFVDAAGWRCDNVTGPVLGAADIRNIRQVRLRLVARSRSPEADWLGARPSIGNHPAGASDSYRRRVMEVTVDVRNSGT